MNSEIRRYNAPRGTTLSESDKGELVMAVDYDALHAETEALRESHNDASHYAARNEELRTELEAARGLLREMDDYLSRRGDGEAIHTGSKFHMAIDAFLTATQAQR